MVTMLQHKAYKYRLDPTTGQENMLYQYAGACRWIYNWGLSRKREYYAENGKGLGYNALAGELVKLKRQDETVWLKEAYAKSLQQALMDLEVSFRNFFEKRARFPKFRSKKNGDYSFRLPQNIRVKDGTILLPKTGWIKMVQHRPIEGVIKNAAFTKDACGHWYVSILTEFELPEIVLPIPDAAAIVGVDVGLKDFLVADSGERTCTPKFYRKAEQKLKRVQRQLSRKKIGSNNRGKARFNVARLHNHVANQRKDFLHKESANLVRQYDAICVEDLCVKGLARTKLAKSVHDAGWGMFRQMLEYKCRWNYKHFVKVNRWYPSSKTCSECGEVNHSLKLSDREWICTACGSILDRDLNAAINIKREGLRILAAGHAESQNACGADVRLLEREAIGVEAGN